MIIGIYAINYDVHNFERELAILVPTWSITFQVEKTLSPEVIPKKYTDKSIWKYETVGMAWVGGRGGSPKSVIGG